MERGNKNGGRQPAELKQSKDRNPVVNIFREILNITQRRNQENRNLKKENQRLADDNSALMERIGELNKTILDLRSRRGPRAMGKRIK